MRTRAALCLRDTRAEPDTEEVRRARMELAERVREEGSGAAARAMVRRVLAERTRKERMAVVEHDAITPPADVEAMARPAGQTRTIRDMMVPDDHARTIKVMTIPASTAV